MILLCFMGSYNASINQHLLDKSNRVMGLDGGGTAFISIQVNVHGLDDCVVSSTAN